MASTNSILSTAKEIIWERAIIKSHGSDYGKTPEDLKYKIENLSHIDIGFEPGRVMIKAFYTGSKKCFYIDIPENQLEHRQQASIEFYRHNPFSEKKIGFK